MKTTTSIRTEFCGMGLKPDGNWRSVTQKASTAAEAEKLLQQHLIDTERYPDLYTKYPEYKVMKRTVITVVEEWTDI